MTDPVTASVMIVLGKYALDKGVGLAKEVGPAAAQKAGELLKTALAYLRRDPKGAVVADEFEQDPETYEKPVQRKLEEAVQSDPGLADQLRSLFTEYEKAAEEYKAAGPTYNATVKGSGAISQGEGDALGERAVKVRDVQGSIITGSGNVVYTGRPAASSATLPSSLAPLRDNLVQTFNKSELKALCFDLGVPHDDLPGETRTELAQALVEHCYERNRLPELIRRCREVRPHVKWE